MRGLIDKKGAAHFEMIFSFVFFVGFVLFLFAVLKPQDTSVLSGSVIASFYDSFEEEVYTNLSSAFLKVNRSGVTKSCFRIVLPDGAFTYVLTDSYVARLDGVEVDSKVDVAGLDIVNVSDFFRVLISPEFGDDSLGSCDVLNDYDLGPVLERRVISYAGLVQMKIDYSNNYDVLRTRLRISPIFDFAIVAETMNEVSMELSSGIPDSVEVQTQDYVVEVLNSSGGLSNERFTLKIW